LTVVERERLVGLAPIDSTILPLPNSSDVGLLTTAHDAALTGIHAHALLVVTATVTDPPDLLTDTELASEKTHAAPCVMLNVLPLITIGPVRDCRLVFGCTV
jgi:hypothetical protein